MAQDIGIGPGMQLIIIQDRLHGALVFIIIPGADGDLVLV